ncbi:SagB family peptide dehydrogenase [Bradyrhizobium sp.]|uniref:SagB/ThcOx family dehydrogenase n=1 Tax=Bradyrhizobium sp. TaxID=376 RepID=UPI0026187755|nr:SagB family peptide dehydrogenase [Bradyrhizobium sp.]
MHIALEPRADGNILAWFNGYSVGLGKFSTAAVEQAQRLRTGLPLTSFSAARSAAVREVDLLVRRLARSGLLEYRFGPPKGGNDHVIIEPQMPEYWPQVAKLAANDRIVLSRFAYMRRRGDEMILESPLAAALFRIRDPKIAATLTSLATPQTLGKLRRQDGFPGAELIGLLLDCGMLFRVAAGSSGLRADEGDDNLVLWDFHDLLFHTHSTEGRQANPLGGLYPYADTMPPPPSVRATWPGQAIDLRHLLPESPNRGSSALNLFRARHSTRDFDDNDPITLAELSQFLDNTARIKAHWENRADLGDGSGPMIAYTVRPYPSGGSSYELELYLTVANCRGLDRGFYHYDADRHALVPISVQPQDIEAQLDSAIFAMDAPNSPQVLITIAARFDRISWKYSSIAYSLVLKNVGVMMQTLYLMAADMGLGGCAIGNNNIDRFARMTGVEFHVEGPVGQFALGRAWIEPE